MNPFDISLELSGLSLFQQPSFRTTILRQVVPDNNFEKMQIIVVDNSFATSRYWQTFYKSCKSLSWTFFATKNVLIGFFHPLIYYFIWEFHRRSLFKTLFHLRYSSCKTIVLLRKKHLACYLLADFLAVFFSFVMEHNTTNDNPSTDK